MGKKRRKGGSSSGEESFNSENRPEPKRVVMERVAERGGGGDVLLEINKKLDQVAKKEDISELKKEMDKMFESLKLRIDKLESRVYDVEKENDGLRNALAATKSENEKVKGSV